MSETRWRTYLVYLLFAVLPIALFAYSPTRVLRKQMETQSSVESAQIARISSSLVAEHFRQSTAFLRAIAADEAFRGAAKHGNWRELNRMEQAHALRPDSVFFSVYQLDGTMRAMYPVDATVLGRNFAFRDWYKGVSSDWSPYISEVYQTAVLPHQLVIALAVTVKDEQGKPTAILMAPYALDTMSKLLVENRRLDSLAGGSEWASRGAS